VGNLTPRLQDLVSRLTGGGAGAPRPFAPLNPAATAADYRQALQRWFELTAQGAAADLAEVRRVHQEILRLIDDVGEPRASALRRQWAREWWQETSLCPFCGEPGPYHDPEYGA